MWKENIYSFGDVCTGDVFKDFGTEFLSLDDYQAALHDIMEHYNDIIDRVRNMYAFLDWYSSYEKYVHWYEDNHLTRDPRDS